MPRTKRCQTFDLDPMAVLTDPAYIAMSHLARSAYWGLLLHAWFEKRPGVIVLRSEDGMARLADLSIEEWLSVQDSVAAGFDTHVSGVWISRLMVDCHEGQTTRIAEASERGRKAVTARWGKRLHTSVLRTEDTSVSDTSVHTSVIPSWSLKDTDRGKDTRPPSVDFDAPAGAGAPVSREPGEASESDSFLEALSPGDRSGRAARRSPFRKPTLEEVRAYCAMRKAVGHRFVDAEAFVDYYESNGWRVGRSPMRDWQCAVRTWERNGGSRPREQKQEPSLGTKLRAFAQTLDQEEGRNGTR